VVLCALAEDSKDLLRKGGPELHRGIRVRKGLLSSLNKEPIQDKVPVLAPRT
jgi:hypothetical protein